MFNADFILEDEGIAYFINQATPMMSIYDVDTEENFYKWINKIEYVAKLIEVPDNKMGEFFFLMVDEDVRKQIEIIYPSINISELSYDEILTKYLDLYIVNEEFYFHRHRFVRRKQYERESIQKYADSLRKILSKCRYTTYPDRILCARFIKGLRDDDIRTYLSNFSCLSFDQMVVKSTEFAKVNLISYYLNEAYLKIKIYCPLKEGEFCIWVNKFEYVADLIGVPDDKMIRFFNEMVHNDIHTSIKQTLPTVDFSGLSYEEIIHHYLSYFYSYNKSDLHRQRFICRDQYEKETIADYANNLQKIYNKCNDRSNFEDELCERFIDGIIDPNVRRFLNKMPGLSFDGFVIMAIGYDKEINPLKGM